MSQSSLSSTAEVQPWVMAVLAAAAQAISIALIVAVGAIDTGGAPWGAYAFAVGFGLLLLVARWAPVTVLIVSIAAVFAYYILGYPPIGMAVPVVGAFFAAALRGRLIVTLVTGAVLLTISLYFRAAEGESSAVLSYELVTNLALICAAVALAMVVRSRRQLGRQQELLVTLEREHERQSAARRLEAERLRIARDVHDSVGHALSLVSVQAEVGQQAIGVDDETVAGAFDRIVTASKTSLAELRRTLAVLRSDRDASDISLSPAALEKLAQAARDAGLDVGFALDEAELPAPVASAAFRIVQEALTNVLRHARARSVAVAVRVSGDVLMVEVADDGIGRSPAAHAEDTSIRPGRGLAGMRERAEAVGGSLITRSSAEGFVVSAELPINQTAPGR